MKVPSCLAVHVSMLCRRSHPDHPQRNAHSSTESWHHRRRGSTRRGGRIQLAAARAVLQLLLRPADVSCPLHTHATTRDPTILRTARRCRSTYLSRDNALLCGSDSKDAGLWGVDDSGEARDAEHTQVRNRKGATLRFGSDKRVLVGSFKVSTRAHIQAPIPPQVR